jgi:hypothetical protein
LLKINKNSTLKDKITKQIKEKKQPNKEKKGLGTRPILGGPTRLG